MEMVGQFKFQVALTRQELRIVGLALSGRLKARSDVTEALKLNDTLLIHWERVLASELGMVQGARDYTAGQLTTVAEAHPEVEVLARRSMSK